MLGAILLTWLLVLSVRDMADPDNSYSGQAWLGVGPPLVIGASIIVVAFVVMFWWRLSDDRFWEERAVPDPDVVHGRRRAAADPDGLEG